VNASHDSHDTTAGRPAAGSLIKRWRQARGLTQRELAAAAGVSLGTLRDLEQSRTTAPHSKLVAELTAQLGFAARQYPGPVPGSGPGGAWIRIDLLGPLAA
jgi:transcriptional regulator with XRE-family HTH domain